jgi:hypothetical protein
MAAQPEKVGHSPKSEAKSEKSTSTMRQTTICHDFPYFVVVEGLGNKKKSFSIYHKTEQNCARRGVFSNDQKCQSW